MNFKDIFPLDKGDTDSVIKLMNYSFDELKPFASDLLNCLQDMNWPIASYMAIYLRPYVNELSNEIVEVFRSNDDMWKYWLITSLLSKVDYEINTQLINELMRIRDNPSSGERDNEVDQVARETLNYLKDY